MAGGEAALRHFRYQGSRLVSSRRQAAGLSHTPLTRDTSAMRILSSLNSAASVQNGLQTETQAVFALSSVFQPPENKVQSDTLWWVEELARSFNEDHLPTTANQST